MNSKDNFSPESENQLTKVFPQIFLRLEEIHLRPLSLDDQAPIAISANDPDIQRWLPLPFPYTESHANSWVKESIRKHSIGSGFVGVIDYHDKFCGVLDVNRVDWIAMTCEISYWIALDARRHNLASASLGMMSNYLIHDMNFNRVEVRVSTENLASQGVALKAGFSREGIARNSGITNSGQTDLVIYSKIPSDF